MGEKDLATRAGPGSVFPVKASKRIRPCWLRGNPEPARNVSTPSLRKKRSPDRENRGFGRRERTGSRLFRFRVSKNLTTYSSRRVSSVSLPRTHARPFPPESAIWERMVVHPPAGGCSGGPDSLVSRTGLPPQRRGPRPCAASNPLHKRYPPDPMCTSRHGRGTHPKPHCPSLLTGRCKTMR